MAFAVCSATVWTALSDRGTERCPWILGRVLVKPGLEHGSLHCLALRVLQLIVKCWHLFLLWLLRGHFRRYDLGDDWQEDSIMKSLASRMRRKRQLVWPARKAMLLMLQRTPEPRGTKMPEKIACSKNGSSFQHLYSQSPGVQDKACTILLNLTREELRRDTKQIILRSTG